MKKDLHFGKEETIILNLECIAPFQTGKGTDQDYIRFQETDHDCIAEFCHCPDGGADDDEIVQPLAAARR
ncbi:MAG: hypothetical protein II451_02785, partial [Oscillospiraceae bacterium]|nr:hypothetical protein [Oscillospiraceae bacterium]